MTLKNNNVLKIFINFIQGAIIGTGAILPGISGGVLCVAFGIYQPIMEFLAHPIKNFKKYIKLLFPILIGFVFGFFLLAKLIILLFELSPTITSMLFAGLIFGTIPSLFKNAQFKEDNNLNKDKASLKDSWTPFVIAFFISYLFFGMVNKSATNNINPNFFWYLFCGLVWGLSLVVPGLSSSSILILIGLYQPMTKGIASFNFGVIIPLVLGLLITVLLTVRGVNYLFKKHYYLISKIILGIMIASSLLIIPTSYSSVLIFVSSVACFVFGFIISFFMSKAKKKEEENF